MQKLAIYSLTFRQKNTLIGWSFVLPAVGLLSVFGIGSIAYVLYLSLLRWNLIDPTPTFVGLANYNQLLHSTSFLHAILRTLFYLVVSTGITLPLSLFLAVLLHEPFRGVRIFRALFFIPYVAPTVASAIAWSWLFEPHHGLINYFLRVFHMPAQPWLGSPNQAMLVIILLYVWQFTGYFIVLFLNGLQNVPVPLYEAAQMDGANRWQQFYRVTLPMITPTLFFVMTMSIIFSFLSFDQVYVLTNGGPADSTTTIIYYLFLQGFQFFHIGIAAAVAVLLLLFLAVITYLQFKGESKWVHHQM
ncbi:MAG: sugar ABC transporter permease [Acidibacillus sp.]|uniref:Lactose transport system permease protein LacF n=1 Tax=Sulfoacidibacillus ferrooxidans TaxID=2005001 RepID=A0A9X2AB80_9BACL|nr:sugar ABC transporter permease [Sulfoacidibacillus ferrooxidans]MCI0182409.1 Lactose transport system permease protein LacF [Sulfoacidibacillus ferrooxidans]MCY0893624.1 sugar ABC transporter permease [Acidibacillus sp.]